MFRLLGYLCNDATLNATFFTQGLEQLDLSEVDVRGGLGLGWIQEGRSLLRTAPRPAETHVRLGAMLGDIPARGLIAHSRDDSEDPANTLDLQPFRYRRWVYAHTGELPASSDLREEMTGEIPEFIAGNIKGESGEELMFHSFLTQLHRSGQLGDGPTDPRACGEALDRAVNQAREHGLAEYGALAVSERLIVFASAGVPIWYRSVRGLTDAREKPLFAGHRPKPVEHPSFKAFVAVQADEAPGSDWERAPDNQVGWVGRDWKVNFVSSGG